MHTIAPFLQNTNYKMPPKRWTRRAGGGEGEGWGGGWGGGERRTNVWKGLWIPTSYGVCSEDHQNSKHHLPMHFLAHFELSSSHIELIGPGKKKTRRYINLFFFLFFLIKGRKKEWKKNKIERGKKENRERNRKQDWKEEDVKTHFLFFGCI